MLPSGWPHEPKHFLPNLAIVCRWVLFWFQTRTPRHLEGYQTRPRGLVLVRLDVFQHPVLNLTLVCDISPPSCPLSVKHWPLGKYPPPLVGEKQLDAGFVSFLSEVRSPRNSGVIASDAQSGGTFNDNDLQMSARKFDLQETLGSRVESKIVNAMMAYSGEKHFPFSGSVYGYSQVDNYDSLLAVLRDLNEEEKQQLVRKIQVRKSILLPSPLQLVSHNCTMQH